MAMKTGLLLSTLLVLLLPNAGRAVSCRAAFKSFQEEIGTNFTQKEAERLLTEARSHRKATVRVAGDLPGLHGGRRILLERIGETWDSWSTSLKGEHDPQGDPRMFIEVVGKDAAKFFGFEVLSDTKMLIPDRTEFVAAVDKLNAEMKRRGLEPLAVTFYEQASVNYENPEKVPSAMAALALYGVRFVETGGVPLAATLNHLLHDLSYHSTALFLPNYLVRYGRWRMDLHLQFTRFLEEKYGSSSPKIIRAARIYQAQILLVTAKVIDVGTANMGVGVLSGQHEEPYTRGVPEEMFDDIIMHSLIGGHRVKFDETSPANWMRKIIRLKLYYGKAKDSETRTLLKRANEAVPARQIAEDFDVFMKSVYQSPSVEFNPNRIFRVSSTKGSRDLLRRRQEIREVLLELSRP